MNLSRALLADFAEESKSTRKMLEGIPADRFDWKPHEKSMSVAQLAGHLAETPTWASAMMEDELDFAAAGASYQPFVPGNRAELLTVFEKNSRAFDQTLAGRDDDFMQRTWTMRNGPKVLMSMPRHAALRVTLIHHLIHHRGQLSVYLRLLGAPVPPTYGPTADHPSF